MAKHLLESLNREALPAFTIKMCKILSARWGRFCLPVEIGLFFNVWWFLFCSLSGNKGLCGVPTLPACPFFWDRGLSTGGKIAIGLACAVVVSLIFLVIYILCKRGRNDYDFGLPQDLICEWLLLYFYFFDL